MARGAAFFDLDRTLLRRSSALEPVLRPLLAPEIVSAAEALRAEGYRLYIVSTALQEIAS